MSAPDLPRILFVTGKLAEPALRRVLTDLAPLAGFVAEVAVLPITVAALLTADWVRRKLTVPPGTDRVLLPGHCSGDLAELTAAAGVPVDRGPKDLHDLPEFFGKRSGPPPEYGVWDIEILAEINNAPRKSLDRIREIAARYAADGAEVIDLGCDPGHTWDGIGDAVRQLIADGRRVSVDSFNPAEVEAGLAAGAGLVLSVNGTNVDRAVEWGTSFPAAEFVVMPDTTTDLASLERTVEKLLVAGVRIRLDAVLEPIGFGFASSLGRFMEVRRRFPQTPIMMGIGNVTELTEVDSAGVNVLLAAICQELDVQSVLTTEVANACRSAVKEFHLARRLVRHAIREKVIPKRLEPDLLLLRDAKLYERGEEELAELARRVTDRNYRLFAERGELHVINGSMHLRGTDPFDLFAEMLKRDKKLDPAHAFYLGYEFAKAVTALTLGKNYTQDRALRWGFLTVPEIDHRHPDQPD